MATAPKPGTHVLEARDTDEALEAPYHLILLDDQSHTYNYVIRMLGDVFGYSAEKSFAIACVVDSNGQAIVLTAGKTQVSTKQSQIHAYGADPSMENSLGSMSAIIEPVC